MQADAINEIDNSFDLNKVLWGISWGRLLLYTGFYLAVIVLQLLQGDFLNLDVWQPLNITIAFAFISQLVLIEKGFDAKFGFIYFYSVLFLDSLIIGSVLWITAIPHSAFLFFMLVNVAIGAYVMGLSLGIKLALWSAFIFNIVYTLNHHFEPSQLKMVMYVNNLTIFAVAFIGGYLGNQVRFVVKDISKKREEIQTLTDINQILIDNIPSGIMMLDQNFKIVKANRGASRIFEDLSLEGRQLEEISPQLQTEARQLFSKIQPAIYERLEIEYYNYKKEKSILEVLVSQIRKRQMPSGQYIFLIQNVTELKSLEFALQQKEKLAAVGQLAAGIAHEIRNPLASISGSIQLLQTSLQTQTPEEGKLFRIVIKEIDRLNNLISEFLDFVRPDVRIQDPIQINNLVREVLDMVKVNDRLTKNVEQRTELRAQSIIFGHYDKLKQAILNIIINGYQAMGDTLRPELIVQTFEREDKLYLVIRDNGLGISNDNIKKIFEPFHTTKPGGTGLGLAITHKIIETHGGEIFVESEMGRGARFTLVFPVKSVPGADEMKFKKQA